MFYLWGTRMGISYCCGEGYSLTTHTTMECKGTEPFWNLAIFKKGRLCYKKQTPTNLVTCYTPAVCMDDITKGGGGYGSYIYTANCGTYNGVAYYFRMGGDDYNRHLHFKKLVNGTLREFVALDAGTLLEGIPAGTYTPDNFRPLIENYIAGNTERYLAQSVTFHQDGKVIFTTAKLYLKTQYSGTEINLQKDSGLYAYRQGGNIALYAVSGKGSNGNGGYNNYPITVDQDIIFV